MKSIFVAISFALVASLSAQTVIAEECKRHSLSKAMSQELRSLQYRVRSGLNYDAIQRDLKRLQSDASCYEAQVLQAVSIEANAFSKVPARAIPALALLYQNIGENDQRYPLVLRALGKNYAMTGQIADLQELIDLHPNAPEKVKEYWVTSLALAHAQNGDYEAAKAIVDEATLQDTPSAEHFLVAIAIYELIGDASAVERLSAEANALYGELRWPTPLEGMGSNRFEVLYRTRFDPALSDAAPIKPPLPRYPRRAAELGKNGSCEVRFDVSKEGKPVNIEAECTSNLFKSEAERAVSEVEFDPLIYKGKPYVRTGVVYPLEFTISRR